ncbi:protein-disulfide reductase DsbD [Pelomonas sp. KK5]|uniref:protein-disulfide reductase DsbD family protein n=1 Tax=Pelomonas sp. KK5 TaxID=1855730 RepID=UPI00097BB03A|nr:thioredoxin family protein [Pelomonas sp. KK5]
MLTKALILITAILSGIPAVAGAEPSTARTDEVEASLLAAHAVVQPGQRLRLALRQRIAPHWHTYWINPGDSGQATSLDWQLPAGATATPIDWPAPSRQSLGPVTNYGYSDEVLLLSTLTVPAAARSGERFAPTVTATWLVCKDICIPQTVTLGLDLPVAAAAVASADAPALAAAEARLPKPLPWPLRVSHDGQDLTLHWPSDGTAEKAWFFPSAWGVVDHSAPQPLTQAGGEWRLRLPAGEAPPAKALAGVLRVGDAAYQVDLPLPGAVSPRSAAPAADLGLTAALLLALAGGLVLNLMPCVFPVLSIKALSLANQARDSAAATRRLGLAYAAGVLASFAALAAVLLALRTAGAEVGWGLQFQSPLFVLIVAWLLFAVGLSLSGLLEVGASAAGLGAGLAEKPGVAGSFFTGVLAAVVATPCTAPFMGAALAYALAQPAPELLAVFLSLGLGLALPYLLLSWWPLLQRWLPRPGPWMEVLKQALAFPMYGAAIWLVWVLAQQAGAGGVLTALAGMLALGFAAWLRMALRPGRWREGLAALVLVATLAGGVVALRPAPPAGEAAQAYSPERLAALRAEGKPVFVNLTAAWCISCLVNERVALARPEVREAFERGGVHYLKGDWTRQDARITALLAEHGRSGVPLYLYFPPGGGEAAVLPQLLTPAIVIDALKSGVSS